MALQISIKDHFVLKVDHLNVAFYLALSSKEVCRVHNMGKGERKSPLFPMLSFYILKDNAYYYAEPKRL